MLFNVDSDRARFMPPLYPRESLFHVYAVDLKALQRAVIATPSSYIERLRKMACAVLRFTAAGW